MEQNLNVKTCCFTGHRYIPAAQTAQIAQRLRNTIIDLVQHGITYFGTGGALGFDTMAANTVLELKKTFPQIRLILVLPCKTQTRGWRRSDIAVYETILQRCDKVVYISDQYTPDCMFRRNRHLVDHCSVCVCYLSKNTGGTAYTVQYARSKGLLIHNLYKDVSAPICATEQPACNCND